MAKGKKGAAKLTKKQEAFALAYVKLQNASAAYREVYDAKGMSPKTINEAASRLLADGKVSARVATFAQKVEERAGLSIERTLREVARLSYFDPRKLYREDGNVKRPDEWDDDTAAAVGGIDVSEEFEGQGEDRKLVGYLKKFKIWDKNAALEKAMKHHGLYERDNVQRAESLELEVVLVAAKK